jgi:hypothetical protein
VPARPRLSKAHKIERAQPHPAVLVTVDPGYGAPAALALLHPEIASSAIEMQAGCLRSLVTGSNGRGGMRSAVASGDRDPLLARAAVFRSPCERRRSMHRSVSCAWQAIGPPLTKYTPIDTVRRLGRELINP